MTIDENATKTLPLLSDFGSSVGRVLHRERKGRCFESRSEREKFSGHLSSSAMGAFASIICLLFKNHDTAFTGMLPTLSWVTRLETSGWDFFALYDQSFGEGEMGCRRQA